LDSAGLADLQGERIDPHVGVGPAVEGSVAELPHRQVEVLGHLRYPRLRDALDAERLDQTVDATGRDPLDVALGYDRDQRSFGTPARLKEPTREIAPLPQLRDLNVDRADPGVYRSSVDTRFGG
jgi:hypothetical protein